jgi:ubiquinone/menaquinone biosynthesis C-methylase UbiE
MSTSIVSTALDKMFERPQGLYGTINDIPLIAQKGHERRTAILASLDIGDLGGKTCLDFGMGGWGFAGIFPKLHDCSHAIGMDISRTALEQSRRLVAEAKPPYAADFQTHQSDGMHLPLPDNSVDLIFSGESIEHIKFPPTFLSECYRVLKPNGQLVITTPNKDAIIYKNMGEEYCISGEHFWLFGYTEICPMLSEFFEIKQQFGFNGSLGPELDQTLTDQNFARRWSEAFAEAPDLATGLIFHCVKRPNITYRYNIRDVSINDTNISGPYERLDLALGLTGIMLNNPDKVIRFLRPPSDGVVCRLWAHRWSGKAVIADGNWRDEINLYSFLPGWRNWISDRKTTTPQMITIAPLGQKDERALQDQVLFLEAFTYHVEPI